MQNSSPTTAESFQEVTTAAQQYLDMLYDGNADKADEVFHPGAQLATLDGDKVIYRTVSEYKDILRGRASPRSLNAPREDQLITLDLATPKQAMVKVKMRINDLFFIDHLTLVRLNEGWRIVSKTYFRL